MMGRAHALSGWCAGMAIAPLVGLDNLAQAAPFAATVAGCALLPDLDHPSSRASRIAGPVTGMLSKGLRWSSKKLYAATKGKKDERIEGGHRHMTHTIAFAVLLGGLTTGLARGFGIWAVLAVLLMGLILAIDALGAWMLAVPVLVIIAIFASGDPWHAFQSSLQPGSAVLGISVALGCFVHCLGDSITVSGCPWLWPVPIRGETWYEIRPPKFMRFRAGGKMENYVLFPLFAVLGVLLIPGVWDQIMHMVGGQPT
jgi:membrane-bound metal-dependent hydrolase YbcI (DUF457 family)